MVSLPLHLNLKIKLNQITCFFIVPSPSSQDIASDNLLQVREHYFSFFPTDAPSDLAKPKAISDLRDAFNYVRPPSRYPIIPPTLLHPVFNAFLHDCDHLVPTLRDNLLALELSKSMSGVFKEEYERRDECIAALGRSDIHLQPTEILGTKFRTDGDHRVSGFRTCIAEFKLELGQVGSDPIYQAALYYTNSIRHANNKHHHLRSPFPCLGIYIVGQLFFPKN